MRVQAELSLYPLGRDSFSPVIDEFVRGLSQPGIRVTTGAMSTVISGESDAVFRVVRECFEKTALSHEAVLVAKYSNACPVCGI